MNSSYFIFIVFLDELVTINATPTIIMPVAINTCGESCSLDIAQPRNTAIMGTVYANELAMD